MASAHFLGTGLTEEKGATVLNPNHRQYWPCTEEYIIEGSLEVKLPTIWTDEEQGRGRDRRKIRREKSRRERVRRKKMQMREKVGKSPNTVFFQWFVAPEGRKVGSLKRRVRSHLARWEMKNCTPLWREAHFEVKMYKTHHSRTTFGSWDVEKVHAVVARSTFRNQHVQSTSASDHFWELRCRKRARLCGAKHICKWKCTKHHMFAPLLEVQMSKKCMPLWREAHFEVNMLKTPGFRTTFGGSDVASLHYTALHYTTFHYTALHYTTLHYITQHYNYNYTTTLHYTPLHSSTLNHATLHYTTLHSFHYTTLHYTTTHYTSLHYTTLHYNYNYTTTLHYNTLHYTKLHYTTLHYTPLHSTTLHYITLRSTTLQLQLRMRNYTPLHSTTLNYTTLHYITLHYIPLHSTTLHYITLYYFTLNDTAPQIDRSTDRQIDRWMDRQVDSQTDRQMKERERDRLDR